MIHTKNQVPRKIPKCREDIKTVIEGFEQDMPVDMKWDDILRNAKNKEQLINITAKFIKSNKGGQLTNSPFIVTIGDKIYGFQDGKTK